MAIIATVTVPSLNSWTGHLMVEAGFLSWNYYHLTHTLGEKLRKSARQEPLLHQLNRRNHKKIRAFYGQFSQVSKSRDKFLFAANTHLEQTLDFRDALVEPA